MLHHNFGSLELVSSCTLFTDRYLKNTIISILTKSYNIWRYCQSLISKPLKKYEIDKIRAIHLNWNRPLKHWPVSDSVNLLRTTHICSSESVATAVGIPVSMSPLLGMNFSTSTCSKFHLYTLDSSGSEEMFTNVHSKIHLQLFMYSLDMKLW